MKRFRLNIGLLLAAMAGCVALSVRLFLSGWWAPACLAGILALLCVFGLWSLQTRLINMMSTFVSALEMNDTTLRIEADGDKELKEMSAVMNRISQLYRSNLRELETRKLYYDRILKIMTHEMRNGIAPLVAITADMESHPERYEGDRLSEASALLHGQVEGIKRFLDSYYNLTHLPEPEITTVKALDYFATVERLAVSELRQRGLADNMVSFIVPEDMELHIDTALMNQVMLNLLRNAFDAVDRRDGKVEVVVTLSDMQPYITIKDNGVGMPAEVMENLFQPFYTTKVDGSGVGLCLCRQIVRRHGGDMRIQSQPGRGTSVILSL